MSPRWNWARGKAAPAAVSRVSAAIRRRTTRSAMPTPVVISRARVRRSTTRTAPWRESWGGGPFLFGGGAGGVLGLRQRDQDREVMTVNLLKDFGKATPLRARGPGSMGPLPLRVAVWEGLV